MCKLLINVFFLVFITTDIINGEQKPTSLVMTSGLKIQKTIENGTNEWRITFFQKPRYVELIFSLCSVKSNKGKTDLVVKIIYNKYNAFTNFFDHVEC